MSNINKKMHAISRHEFARTQINNKHSNKRSNIPAAFAHRAQEGARKVAGRGEALRTLAGA